MQIRIFCKIFTPGHFSSPIYLCESPRYRGRSDDPPRIPTATTLEISFWDHCLRHLDAHQMILSFASVTGDPRLCSCWSPAAWACGITLLVAVLNFLSLIFTITTNVSWIVLFLVSCNCQPLSTQMVQPDNSTT